MAQSPSSFDESFDGVHHWSMEEMSLNLSTDLEADVSKNLNPKTRGITRSHWIKNKSTHCNNKSCSKQFRLTERPHHCRRCGDEFCHSCLGHKKRLNYLAQPDPDGQNQKVCQKCFNEEKQTVGPTRDLSETFQRLRREKGTRRGSTELLTPEPAVNIDNFREFMDIEKECKRLEEGFKRSLMNSIVDNFVENLVKAKKHPWKRSSYWPITNKSSKCSDCEVVIGVFNLPRNCVICGSVVCVDCACKDLIVFTADHTDINDAQTRAELAITETNGQKDPARCMHLRTCPKCYMELKKRQTMSQIVKGSDKCREIRNRIDENVTKYRELTETFEALSNPLITAKFRTDLQALVKAQSCLSELLPELRKTSLAVKHLKPYIPAQGKIITNIYWGTTSFYQDNQSLFAQLQKRVEVAVRKEVLDEYQKKIFESEKGRE